MEELKRERYQELLQPLQVRLSGVQRWLQATGQRLVVVFEGRDAAGKGGAIQCFTKVLNPRWCKVAALPKPSERERGQWYFQRYAAHLPAAGEITLFDRSWYNRAGVERVMGFCSDAEYRRFLRDCPVFERMLVADGLLLFKYWFSVDQRYQEQRFAERLKDPIKRWKISPVDLAARDRYAEYGKAANAMFRATHIPEAPWHVVNANDQKRARLNMLHHLLQCLKAPAAREKPPSLPPLKRRKLGTERIDAKTVRVPEVY